MWQGHDGLPGSVAGTVERRHGLPSPPMSSPSLPLLITAGEPAGIGPDLCVMLAQSVDHSPPPGGLVFLADHDVLRSRAAQLGLPFTLPDYQPGQHQPVSVLHLPVAVPVHAGHLDAGNGAYVLDTLRRAAACASP